MIQKRDEAHFQRHVRVRTGGAGGLGGFGAHPALETKSSDHASGTDGGAEGRIDKERGGPKISPPRRRSRHADEQELFPHRGFNVSGQPMGGNWVDRGVLPSVAPEITQTTLRLRAEEEE